MADVKARLKQNTESMDLRVAASEEKLSQQLVEVVGERSAKFETKLTSLHGEIARLQNESARQNSQLQDALDQISALTVEKTQLLERLERIEAEFEQFRGEN